MASKKIFTAAFRRKREGKTDYKRRLALLKSKTPRLVIRKSNKHIQAQLVKYGNTGDIVLSSVHSKELVKQGWKYNCGNVPSAYLVGLILGVACRGQEAITDLGLQSPVKGARIFAVIKGASDGGLKIKFSEKNIPEEKRITGTHIANYAEQLKKDNKKFETIFSGYVKTKVDPMKINESFLKTKEKILGSKGKND